MPTRHGLPGPDEATPYPGAPQYFSRQWNMAWNTIQALGPDLKPIGEPESISAPRALTIYGYSCRSTYVEDHAYEDQRWTRGRDFPAVCFSEVERDGEYGFVPEHAVTLIDRQELDEALARIGTTFVTRDSIAKAFAEVEENERRSTE